MTTERNSPAPSNLRFPTFQRLGRWLCSASTLKRLGFCALGLVTLIALYYAIENWRGASEWKKVRADMVARGEPLSFAELVPPMPPDDENFAMSPFFRGFFDKSLSADGKTAIWSVRQQESKLPEWPNKLKEDTTWRLGERHEFAWNLRSSELQNAALRKESLQDELNTRFHATDLDVLDDVNITTNTPVEAVRRLLVMSQPVLSEIEAATRRPRAQFPVHFDDNVGALLPHLSKLKTLGLLFSLRALLHLKTGNSEAALADILTTLRLADTVKNEPILVSQLVRQAILNLSLQPIWEGLADRVWTADQLQTLQAQLARADVLTGYQQAMRGERTFALDLADIVERERSFSRVGGNNAPNYYPPEQQLRDRLIDYAPRGWYLHNKAFMARLHNDISVPAVDPVNHRVHLDRMGDYDAELEAAITSDGKLFIARLVMPAVGKAAIRAAADQAAIDLAMVGCALERHRLAKGAYPDQLAALAPEFLAALPPDVVDGQPLRYRSAGESFVLYSIGANGKDDGGQAGFKKTTKGRDWRRDEGDWVWSYPQ